MSFNDACVRTRLNPNDECYTPAWYAAEVTQKYAEHLRGKTVFCPCDDPRWSGFAKYLLENFFALNLRAVVCACYYPRKDGRMEQLTAIFHPERHRGVFANDSKIDNPYLRRAVVDRNRTSEEKAFRAEVAKNVKFPTAVFGAAQKNIMVTLVETLEDLGGPMQGCFEDNGEKICKENKIEKSGLKGAFEWTQVSTQLLELSDVVITNPPFSKVVGKGVEKGHGLLEVVVRRNKDYIFVGNFVPTLVHLEFARQNKLFYGGGAKSVDFRTPSGDVNPVGVVDYSSFKIARGEEQPIGYKKRSLSDVLASGAGYFVNREAFAKTAVLQGRQLISAPESKNGILEVDEYGDVPADYDGPVLVAKTVATRIVSGDGFSLVGYARIYADDNRKDRMCAVIKRTQNAKQAEEAAVSVANTQTPDRGDAKKGLGYVYLIYDGKDRIKIGITRRSVGERLREIKTACPHAAVWDVSPAIEEYALAEELLHEQFKAYNVGGEWFKIEAYPEIKKAFLAITEPCKSRK